MKKLSAVQAHVMDRMANGWELTSGGLFSGRSWLQQGGAGRGGPSETVSRATLSALLKAGLIEHAKRGFPTTTYRLTTPKEGGDA